MGPLHAGAARLAGSRPRSRIERLDPYGKRHVGICQSASHPPRRGRQRPSHGRHPGARGTRYDGVVPHHTPPAGSRLGGRHPDRRHTERRRPSLVRRFRDPNRRSASPGPDDPGTQSPPDPFGKGGTSEVSLSVARMRPDRCGLGRVVDTRPTGRREQGSRIG